jgi:Eco57I restriction endonuclease.
MKFDIIITNPPYQENDNGHKNSCKPLYHKFIQASKELDPNYIIMIIPNRWYAGGKGLDTFRCEMINDTRIEKLIDFESSKFVFDNVGIAGGICYFLWNKNHNGNCEITNINYNNTNTSIRSLNQFDILIRNNDSISIINKIIKSKINTLDSIVSGRNCFNFQSNFRGQIEKFNNSITLFTSEGISYIDKFIITKNNNLINKYKVIISKSVPCNGETNIDPKCGYKVTTTPLILKPDVVCTDTYLMLNTFDIEQKAINMCNFMKLKLPRYLLKQCLNSININKGCFKFVPYEDFDIKWNDKMLYNKYNLTDNEINIVETTIRDFK